MEPQDVVPGRTRDALDSRRQGRSRAFVFSGAFTPRARPGIELPSPVVRKYFCSIMLPASQVRTHGGDPRESVAPRLACRERASGQ